jgi:Putative auto-transporter adhesin, head GIN domain
MRALIKVALSLLLLAFVLIGLSYSVLRAQGISTPANREGHAIAAESRKVGKDVAAVDLDGPIDLTLRQGPMPSLVVRGEQRLLKNVATSEENGTLHIGTTGMLLLHRQPLQVVLVLPSLKSLRFRGSGESNVNGFSGERVQIELNGSGDIKFNGRYKDIAAAVHGSGELELNGGNSDTVTVELVGSGQVTVVGATRQLTAEQTGSGDLDAQHLAAEEVRVELRGSGSSTVLATKTVAVTLRGSGDVTVFGSPNERSVSRNGSGEVSFNP